MQACQETPVHPAHREENCQHGAGGDLDLTSGCGPGAAGLGEQGQEEQRRADHADGSGDGNVSGEGRPGSRERGGHRQRGAGMRDHPDDDPGSMAWLTASEQGGAALLARRSRSEAEHETGPRLTDRRSDGVAGVFPSRRVANACSRPTRRSAVRGLGVARAYGRCIECVAKIEVSS